MSTSRLRRLFARTLRASLATPLVLTGCEVPEVEPDPARFTSPRCEGGGMSVAGLQPAVPPDFVELRRVARDSGGDAPRVDAHTRSGTPCATASRPDVCQSELAALAPNEAFRRHWPVDSYYTEYYVATTRGDAVQAHASLQQLRAFLGTIDTPQEAALLAFANSYDLSCDTLSRGAVAANTNGTYTVIASRGYGCGPHDDVRQLFLEVTPSGEVKEVDSRLIEKGNPNCVIGRRPAGLRTGAGVACDEALGRHFASAAHLEAASIQAFLRLREELALHGADESLRDAALRSALDEVMHAEASKQLALRFGATPPRLEVDTPPPRSLFALALDNVVEGCTRETFGALVAHHQALHAQDAQVRALMGRIAEDETRHAELAWGIDAWVRPRLSQAECAALDAARREAVAVLREEATWVPDAALVTEAGLPPPELATAWVASLEQELWA